MGSRVPAREEANKLRPAIIMVYIAWFVYRTVFALQKNFMKWRNAYDKNKWRTIKQ